MSAAVIVFAMLMAAAGFYAYALGRPSAKRSWLGQRWPYASAVALVAAVWVIMHVADHRALVSYCAGRDGQIVRVPGIGDVCVISPSTPTDTTQNGDGNEA